MKWVHYFLLFLLVSGLSGVARAQNQLRNDPGFVDFAEIDRWFDSEARIEVNIHGALLRLVAEASRNEDPDFANVLNRLKGIYVRGYTLPPSQYGKIERNASELGKRLEARGWETVARVREEGDRVDMYINVQDDAIAGLVVMAIASGEDDTIFINIVGDIDPEEIGRIGSRFNIDDLDRRTGRRSSRY